MTTVKDDERFRQPTVKRLGLDDGWWFFCPHFLNLGLPLVFVDACLLPDSDDLGLETFGTRKPGEPLPVVDLAFGLLGNAASLYTTSGRPDLVAAHRFRQLTLPPAPHPTKIGILVGDSYALQLTWSALWRCHIGAVVWAQIERT